MKPGDIAKGKNCGECGLCCKLIGVESIGKPQFTWCRHFKRSVGCGIYEDRPHDCRAFICYWLHVPNLGDEWRPDRSGVLPYVETEGISEDFDLSTGIGLMLVGNPLKIVRQKSFQDFVTTGVMSSVPLFLSLPGPRGHQAATVSLNTEQMVEAVSRGAVKDALEVAVKLLRGWDFQPAAITFSGNDVSSPEQF